MSNKALLLTISGPIGELGNIHWMVTAQQKETKKGTIAIQHTAWKECLLANLIADSNNLGFSIPIDLSEVPKTAGFIGRREDLDKIEKVLQADGSYRQILILDGPNGVGKSQLAAKFIKDRARTFSAVFWLNARNKETVKQGFAKIAKRLHRKYPSDATWKRLSEIQDLNKTVEPIIQWLSEEGNTRWIMIFDGMEGSPSYDVNSFFPKVNQGIILITIETASRLKRIGEIVTVGKLRNIQESIEMLAHASGREISGTIRNHDVR